jgi:hypothetical protein
MTDCKVADTAPRVGMSVYCPPIPMVGIIVPRETPWTADLGEGAHDGG